MRGPLGRIVQVQRAEARTHDLARVPRDGVEKLLFLEFGHQGLADRDERLQLAGLALKLTELPEAPYDRCGLGGQALEQCKVSRRESAGPIAVEVDDADDPAVGFHRSRHLTAHVRPELDIAGIGGDIGNELRLLVKGDPAGDALADAQGDIGAVGRQPLLNLHLEPAGVGAEQGDRAAGCVEQAADLPENDIKRRLRILHLGSHRGDPVEHGKGAGIGRSGKAWFRRRRLHGGPAGSRRGGLLNRRRDRLPRAGVGSLETEGPRPPGLWPARRRGSAGWR